jgi:hypothetical protein
MRGRGRVPAESQRALPGWTKLTNAIGCLCESECKQVDCQIPPVSMAIVASDAQPAWCHLRQGNGR